jgi:hypothetical protein
MTEPEPSSSSDRIAAAFDDFADTAARAFENADKLLNGTYSADDASADVNFYGTKALGWAQDLMECWVELGSTLVEPSGKGPPIPQPNPTITVHLPAAATRPITLKADRFRAVGWGTIYEIASSAVIFENPVVQPGQNSFKVTVSTTALPRDACVRTLVFEGTVIDTQTGGVVGDTVRFVRPADAHGARG